MPSSSRSRLLIDAHIDALEADLRRREDGVSLIEEGVELSGDLRAYIRAAWHVLQPSTKFIDNWHIGAMCDKLEAVTRGEIDKLLIWVPPGTMKTITGDVAWPTWEWTSRPGLRYMTSTYDLEMQIEIGMLPSRLLIESDWYQDRWSHVYRMRLDLNKRAVYANDHGGARYAVAPNAKKVTGRHVHRILHDDPNDALSAEGTSESELQKVIDWHDGTLPTRHQDPERPVEIIIQQRLHEKDLSGHVHDETWEVLCLPERYDPKHPFVWPEDPRTEPGELLWPSRIGETANAARKKTLGSHRASGQLQQEPTSRTGEILLRAWWAYYHPAKLEKADYGDVSELPRFSQIICSWDTAFQDKTTSDNVAGGIFGCHGADSYLLRTWNDQANLPRTMTLMMEYRDWAIARWPRAACRVLIENKSNGPQIIAEMRRKVPGIVKYNPGNLDKIQRAIAATPEIESGNVFVAGVPMPPFDEQGRGEDYDPTRTPAWAQDVIEQCVKFPKGAHDDLVDMVTQLVNYRRIQGLGRTRVYSPANVQLPALAGVPTGGSSTFPS